MKLFIPAIGYRIRLTQDWTFKLFHERRNESLLEFIVPNYQRKWHFGDTQMPHETTSLSAGTVLEVDRVYVRTINKRAVTEEDDYDSVTFKVIDHPSKKKFRFWAKLDDVNNIDYEIPSDVTVSKDQAREAAKTRQLKLTKEACINHICSAFYYEDRKFKANWWTPQLRKDLDKLAAEYAARHRPLETIRVNEIFAREKHDAKYRFENGEIFVALGQAEELKNMSFEDWWKKEEITRHQNRGVNERVYATSYFIPYTLLKGGYQTKSSFKQLENGERRRQFRGPTLAAQKERHVFRDLGFVDFSDMYVNVITNAEDTEILRVEAGIDKKETT
jgi:hypothetical protein